MNKKVHKSSCGNRLTYPREQLCLGKLSKTSLAYSSSWGKYVQMCTNAALEYPEELLLGRCEAQSQQQLRWQQVHCSELDNWLRKEDSEMLHRGLANEYLVLSSRNKRKWQQVAAGGSRQQG